MDERGRTPRFQRGARRVAGIGATSPLAGASVKDSSPSRCGPPPSRLHPGEPTDAPQASASAGGCFLVPPGVTRHQGGLRWRRDAESAREIKGR